MLENVSADVFCDVVCFSPLVPLLRGRFRNSLDPLTLNPGDKTHIEMNFDVDTVGEATGMGLFCCFSSGFGEGFWDNVLDDFHVIGDSKTRETHCDNCKRTNSDAKNTASDGVCADKLCRGLLGSELVSAELERLHLYKRTPSAWWSILPRYLWQFAQLSGWYFVCSSEFSKPYSFISGAST